MSTEKAISIFSTIGLLFGLWLAFHKKKHFWAYIGFALLFSIIGATVGGLIGEITGKKE